MSDGWKSCPSVYIGSRGVNPATSPKSYWKLPRVELRAARWLDRHDPDFFAFREVLAQERESQSREVAAAAEASDHHVRLGVGHLHLRHGFLSDHGLMQDDVVQHASQTVPRIFGVLQRHFDRLRNGQSEASRTVRVAF